MKTQDTTPTMQEHIARLLAELETAKASGTEQDILRIERDLALAYLWND